MERERRAYNYQVEYEEYLRERERCSRKKQHAWVTGSGAQTIATRFKYRPTLAEIRLSGCTHVAIIKEEIERQL